MKQKEREVFAGLMKQPDLKISDYLQNGAKLNLKKVRNKLIKEGRFAATENVSQSIGKPLDKDELLKLIKCAKKNNNILSVMGAIRLLKQLDAKAGAREAKLFKSHCEKQSKVAELYWRNKYHLYLTEATALCD